MCKITKEVARKKVDIGQKFEYNPFYRNKIGLCGTFHTTYFKEIIMIRFKQLTRALGAMRKPYMLLAAMTAVTLLSVTFLDVATKAVSISDGDEVTTVYTLSGDADTILDEAGVKLDNADEYRFSGFENGTGSITLMRAFFVTVDANGKTYKLETTGGSVEDALKEAGIKLDEDDLINYALDADLSSDMAIVVTDVDYKTEIKEVVLPFSTKTVYSSSLNEGTVKTTAGKTGIKAVTYRYKLVNGEIVGTEVIDEVINKEAVAAVKTVGTKKVTTVTPTVNNSAANTYSSIKSKCVSGLDPAADFALDANGIPVNYTKKISGKASAYTWTGNRTCTGKVPRTGYIAVNTKIIPLHTKMFIRCSDGSYIYGYAVAEDTGGFAKTTNRVVDMYFNTRSECIQFGVRTVDIYILP